jgi:rhodanese-related sulfurtransferase
MQHNPKFLKLVEQARSNIAEIDVNTLQTWRNEGRQLTVIDCREASERELSYIPDSIHISRGILERDIENIVADVTQPLVIYYGGGYRSALAAANLSQMGYQTVWSLAGGFRAWQEQQLPLVEGDPTHSPD